jgi:dihydrofolate synthase/folylpolyglutamate synthase
MHILPQNSKKQLYTRLHNDSIISQSNQPKSNGEARLSYSDAMTVLKASKKFGSKLGLERITRLCWLIGEPQDGVPAIHIAGTNGKGRASAMISSILISAGYKTGLYQSPYIEDVCECIRIGGRAMSHQELALASKPVAEAAQRMAGEGDPPTEFELETAIAFLWFLRSGCGAMVIEAGLGGRLDATNIIKRPLASVIMSISLDHTGILGGTIGEIAYEKCGIIKPCDITVSYPLQPPEAMKIIEDRAKAMENALILPDIGGLEILHESLEGTDIVYRGLCLRIPLIGRRQVYNAVTAVEAAIALRERRGFSISDAAIADGIRNARLPFRQEVVCLNPVILIDGAHNPDGLAALAETMKAHLQERRTAVVMGMLADKEYEKSIAMIAPLCGKFIASKPDNPRALPSEVAARCAMAHCPNVSVEDDYSNALRQALGYAGRDGAVIACGSLYLAGPMRKACQYILKK